MSTAHSPSKLNATHAVRHDSVAATGASVATATSVLEPPSWTTRAKPKGIKRVPTHAVLPVRERRTFMRANLSLELRVNRVAGQRRARPRSLKTTNISSSGVYFHCPLYIEPGTPLELEVSLVNRPLGQGNVKMTTDAHVVRIDSISRAGWHAVAACFDDIRFQREEPVREIPHQH
jgi:hypothetical protein